METTPYNVECETVESLLLMGILGQEDLRQTALRELRRRRTLRDEEDFAERYMTNFNVIAC